MSSEGESLGVTLNRERLNEATAPGSHRVDGDFAVELRNEGAPVHVHLRFSDPLADVATLPTSNHYVDSEATTRVPIAVSSVEAPVEGTLRVVTGHGAEGTTVALTVDPPPPADVDESFASPPADELVEEQPDESDDADTPSVTTTALELLPDSGTLAVVAVAAGALLAAAVVAVTLDGIAVTLGVVAVLVAVVVAMFLLLE